VITGCFSDIFLIWFGINALFLWRPVYKLKQKEIDALINKAKTQIATIADKVYAQIPKYKD
jgi:hypothetical protein